MARNESSRVECLAFFHWSGPAFFGLFLLFVMGTIFSIRAVAWRPVAALFNASDADADGAGDVADVAWFLVESIIFWSSMSFFEANCLHFLLLTWTQTSDHGYVTLQCQPLSYVLFDQMLSNVANF